MTLVGKYLLELASGTQSVMMPSGSKIVHVHEQNRQPALWAEIDTDREWVSRTFYVVATGEPFEPVAVRFGYVGTVHVDWTVWHVYEVSV